MTATMPIGLAPAIARDASEGRVVSTGAPCPKRYVSILTITDRKVSHWRDYLDPVAVFDALGRPSC
jgi:ketosteroid isomerase-like protein